MVDKSGMRLGVELFPNMLDVLIHIKLLRKWINTRKCKRKVKVTFVYYRHMFEKRGNGIDFVC